MRRCWFNYRPMPENTSTTKIIIILIQHPVFGYLLIPYTTRKGENDTVELIEQAFHLPAKTRNELSAAEQKTIDIAARYSEKRLMAVYSKEKTVSSFLKKVTEKEVKEIIRPFIEKKLLEMIGLICSENLPLYQNKIGNKTLFAHNKCQVYSGFTELNYHFEGDGQQFHYSLQCFRADERISLLEKKPVIVLVTEPAVLVLGHELLMFHNIHASRIIPFTNRAKVSVDASLTGKYLEAIVLPIIKYHRFSQEGLPIFREGRALEGILSAEKDMLYEKQVFRLIFRYADKDFRPGAQASRAFSWMDKENNALHYFERDLEKERFLLQKLRDLHLRLIDDHHLELTPKAPTDDIIGWVTANGEELSTHFKLMSSERNASYCLDEIRVEQSMSEENDWFELRITVIIGKFRIPFIRFRRNILAGNHEYLLPDGKVALLPNEWFSKYSDLLEYGEEREDSFRIKPQFAGIMEDLIFNNKKERAEYQQKAPAEIPKKLKATLRSYQREGFNWMVHLSKHNLGGCLADDMGLGKTLQTLTLLQYIYQTANNSAQLSLFEDNERKPASLVVVPTSLLHNWRRETAKFTALTLYEYGGNGKNLNLERTFDNFNLILTSYGLMRNNVDELGRYMFEYIILDESQVIKNSDSLTFKAAISLLGKQRLILTGTPIENSLKDLWSQFRFIQPGLLGSENDFNSMFIAPIKQGNKRIESKLQKLISPFILRRNKREVAPELPSLTEEIIYCGMGDEQKEMYQYEKNSLRNLLLHFGHSEKRYNNLTVLNGITRLRQLASHPKMLDAGFNGTSGKLEEIISVFETLRSEDHKVLIFSSFVKHLELIGQAFEANGWKYALLTGSTTDREGEIKRFDDPDIQAFLISLKAGGVGLNLTQADYVFIVDPWWNPAAEMQAVSRAHRIGQDKNVFAYRFITEDSIEEKIIRLQESKRKLSETFISDNNPFQSLTDEEWAGLLDE